MKNLRNKTAVMMLKLAKYVTVTALAVRYVPPQKPLTDAEIIERANEIDRRDNLHQLDALSQMLSILTALRAAMDDDLEPETRSAMHEEAHQMVTEINDPVSAHLIINQMAHQLAESVDEATLAEMGRSLALAKEASK